MWDHPNAVVLVAAGNDGANGPNTVGSPATNKNGVAVGASSNAEESWEQRGITRGTDFYNMDSLAWFSSRGPTADDRLKPDVCAPGEILLAGMVTSRVLIFLRYFSSFVVGYMVRGAKALYPVTGMRHCDVTVDMGTSFSSPILASHTALVREYFMSGFYPSGERNPVDGFEPSGALLKAVLIHGGKGLEHIQAETEEEMTPMTHGDNNQGYGRTQLDKSLSFKVNATLDGLTYFVIGAADNSSNHYAALSSGDDPHVYTFRTADRGSLKPIRVTLAYTVRISAHNNFAPHSVIVFITTGVVCHYLRLNI